MHLGRACAAVAIGVLVLSAVARAGLLDLSVNGSSTSINATGNSLPDLVDDLINAKGKFQSIDGQSYNASLNYGGLTNALTLDSNAAGTDVTLRIPRTGFVKQFTGSSRDAVQEQIEDFLLKQGSSAYADFVKLVNETTVLGVVDGNPRGSTAMMSDHAFYLFGMNKPVRADTAAGGKGAPAFSIDASAGVTNNDRLEKVDEDFYNIAIGTGFVGDRIGLTFSTVGNFRSINDSDSSSLGFELGLPIVIIPAAKNGSGICWQVTPVGSLAGGLSYDLAQGGTFWGIGVTSSLSMQVDQFVFTLANQITHYEGFTLQIDEYEFETNVSQEVVKNGLGVAYLFGAAYVDGSVTYTNFLHDAAVDNYWSPAIGLGYRFTPTSGVHIGYRGDFADQYTASAGEISFYFGY